MNKTLALQGILSIVLLAHTFFIMAAENWNSKIAGWYSTGQEAADANCKAYYPTHTAVDLTYFSTTVRRKRRDFVKDSYHTKCQRQDGTFFGSSISYHYCRPPEYEGYIWNDVAKRCVRESCPQGTARDEHGVCGREPLRPGAEPLKQGKPCS